MLTGLLKNHEQKIHRLLTELLYNAPQVNLSGESSIVIFSDLHMGNGKSNDDFKKNASLFTTALKDYYSVNDYTLILNGDVEELQKFSLNSIRSRWADTFRIFDDFAFKEKLFKIAGNHDDSIFDENNNQRYNEIKALKINLDYIDVPLFLYHGHQASLYYKYLNKLNTILLGYIVNPLGIKNFPNKFRHKKKMRIENRSYNFSRSNRLISIIGHTHRPLFESLSRSDSLHFSIETLLRNYRNAEPWLRDPISAEILELKTKYDKSISTKPDYEPASLMYSRGIPVPCLFNTGCTIGKRGITGIEIKNGNIALVHWFDSRVSSRFLFEQEMEPQPMPDNPSIHRLVLREDELSYIADTINLLGGRPSASRPSDIQNKNQEKQNNRYIFQDSKQNLTISC